MEAPTFNRSGSRDITFEFLDTYEVKGDTVTVYYNKETWADTQGTTDMLHELAAHKNESLRDDVENALAMQDTGAEVDDSRPGVVVDDHAVLLYLRPYEGGE